MSARRTAQHASERAERRACTTTGDLATEHRQLVAQHQNLHFLPVVRSATQNEQLHEPPERDGILPRGDYLLTDPTLRL
jgi:hypothetical protein